MTKLLAPAAAALWTVLPATAQAADLTLIGPGGIRAAITQMLPAFEKASGHRVRATFGSGGGTKTRVIKGEPFDVPIVQPPVEPVVQSGHVIPASQTLLASVAVGIAVRAGEPKPDISNAQAVRRLLLAAKAIAYPNAESGAGAGRSFDATLRQLGIDAQMKQKIRIAKNGRDAMVLLAAREVDIGVTYVSEIITEPGVELVDSLPRDISPPTELIAFLSATSKDPEAARALLRYLTSPPTAAVFRERGLEPGH